MLLSILLAMACSGESTPPPPPAPAPVAAPSEPEALEISDIAQMRTLIDKLSAEADDASVRLQIDGEPLTVRLSAGDAKLRWVLPARGDKVLVVHNKSVVAKVLPPELAEATKKLGEKSVELQLGTGRAVGDFRRLVGLAEQSGLTVTTYVPRGFDACGDAPAGMSCIPGGAALVGGPGGDPHRQIQLSTFYVDAKPATKQRIQECRTAGVCTPGTIRRQLDAAVFCAWDGKRLPTALEWEAAAKELGLHPKKFEWTATRDHGDFDSCKTCSGRDPLGPCAGARGCKKNRFVLKGGGNPPAHREIARETNALDTQIRCVASNPWLTAFPPAWVAKPLPAPAKPEPPNDQQLAIFQGVADDPIDDKPICKHGEVGKSGLDCRDQQSYVTPNETRGHVFRKYVHNLGGGYVGVASDQNYSLAAIARSDWVWLMDYDRTVVRLHQALKPLILDAADPDAFVAAFEADASAKSTRRIASYYADHADKDGIVNTYTTIRGTLLRHYQNSREKGTPDDAYGWLRNDDHYAWIRLLHQQDRIAAVGGDMLRDNGALRNIGRAARRLGVPIRIYYTSNAPNAWGGDMTPAYRANVTELPADDRSVVLQALGFKTGFGQTGYWHYNVFWGPEYRRRLSHAGFDKHWKPVVDRIPSDDPDLTVNSLPGIGWSP